MPSSLTLLSLHWLAWASLMDLSMTVLHLVLSTSFNNNKWSECSANHFILQLKFKMSTTNIENTNQRWSKSSDWYRAIIYLTCMTTCKDCQSMCIIYPFDVKPFVPEINLFTYSLDIAKATIIKVSKPVDFRKHSEQKIKFTVLMLITGLLCLTFLHIVSLVSCMQFQI